MRVLALTRYERLGSSSRVRFYQYFSYLQTHGVLIDNAPFFNDTYVQRLYTGRRAQSTSVLYAYAKRLMTLWSGRRYDVVWIEKELFPWLPAWFERLLHRSGIPYVVDYDDAVFHRYDLHPSTLVRRLLGHKIDRVMHHAALVVAGNDYLAEYARSAGASRVEYLPSVVDVSRYALKQNTSDSTLKIGWIGSPVTAPYLDEVKEALAQLSAQASIHVTLIGSGNVTPFPGVPTTVLPWDERRELSIGQIFDVGIMPLVDGPFERGKCGYKLVQYMAGGIPVVASPVGINQQMVEPGRNGYLAASTEEWLEALHTLAGDPQRRIEMGRAGRQLAEQKYNLQSTAPKLLDFLGSAQKAHS